MAQKGVKSKVRIYIYTYSYYWTGRSSLHMLRMFFSGILQISDTEIFTRVDRIIIISSQQRGKYVLKNISILVWTRPQFGFETQRLHPAVQVFPHEIILQKTLISFEVLNVRVWSLSLRKWLVMSLLTTAFTLYLLPFRGHPLNHNHHSYWKKKKNIRVIRQHENREHVLMSTWLYTHMLAGDYQSAGSV